MKKYEIIYEKYRNDILEGFLINGQQLPSIRQSCQLFKASQTTVEHAYEKLMMEGYITSKPQIGFYVSIDQERIKLHQQIDHYSYEHQSISYIYDFRSQTVSQDSFEVSVWKRYLKDVLDDITKLTTYGDSQGEYVLREALCQYAYKVRGVLCHPDQILVGSNYQALLFILCGLLPHKTVIGMEYQENTQTKRVFESYGFQVIMLKSFDDGIDIEDMKRAPLDILYLNSASQGLKKKPLSAKLRKQLLEYTKKENILIIEDDYNGELSYHSREHYAMQGFAFNDNVIYCGSFSRLLLPSLRISYMVLNQQYLRIYQKHKNEYGPTASKLEQLAFSQYIVDGYLYKHLKKLKKDYKEKNQMMLKTLKKYFPFSYYLEEAYLRYHIELVDIDETRLMQICQNHQIAINPIQNHQLLLSFASLPLSEIDEAIQKLYQIINESRIV